MPEEARAVAALTAPRKGQMPSLLFFVDGMDMMDPERTSEGEQVRVVQAQAVMRVPGCRLGRLHVDLHGADKRKRYCPSSEQAHKEQSVLHVESERPQSEICVELC